MSKVIYFEALSLLQLYLGKTGLGITACQNSANKLRFTYMYITHIYNSTLYLPTFSESNA